MVCQRPSVNSDSFPRWKKPCQWRQSRQKSGAAFRPRACCHREAPRSEEGSGEKGTSQAYVHVKPSLHPNAMRKFLPRSQPQSSRSHSYVTWAISTLCIPQLNNFYSLHSTLQQVVMGPFSSVNFLYMYSIVVLFSNPVD